MIYEIFLLRILHYLGNSHASYQITFLFTFTVSDLGLHPFFAFHVSRKCAKEKLRDSSTQYLQSSFHTLRDTLKRRKEHVFMMQGMVITLLEF